MQPFVLRAIVTSSLSAWSGVECPASARRGHARPRASTTDARSARARPDRRRSRPPGTTARDLVDAGRRRRRPARSPPWYSTERVTPASDVASPGAAPGCSDAVGADGDERASRRAPTAAGSTLWPPMNRATKAGRAAGRRPRAAVPACSIRPSFITTIESASAIASSWPWVTWMKLMPSSRCRRFSSSRILTRRNGSSADSGSSSSSTCGSVISARASATRCCWPPESWAGRRSA